MGNSFGFREDHLLSFMEWAHLMSVDPWELFALSRVNCCTDCYKAGCGVSWVEHDWQVPNRPARMSLAQRIAQAEMMIGNYLKTPVGPTYIKGEMHTVQFHKRHHRYAQYSRFSHTHHNNELTIQTRYRHVLKTGTQVLTRIGETLPQTRTFINRKGWDFDDDIIYCIGTPDDPLLMTALDEQEVDNLCNLRIYQHGFGPVNDGCEPIIDADGNVCYIDDWTAQTPQFYHGHRIRPFDATYNGERLCIQVNKSPNVKLELYSKVLQNPKGYLKDIDFCDEDNFPETMDVYNVSYEKPDGVAYLRKSPCQCTSGCDACQMTEVPICLEPIDPINGEFRVVPIVETSEEGEDCCWEATTWNECCDPSYCGCDVPVVICINYMASACGNWDDCCFPDEVCPQLKAAVAYLATSMFTSVCDCGCLDDLFQKYSQDMMMALANTRSGSILYANEMGFQVFGQTRGAYEAYNQIKFLHNILPAGNYMIG